MTASHDVKVGVLLPTREMAITGSYAMAPLADFARRAEALGFDSVWTGDSLLARPRLDPFVVLAVAAAVTSRVTLGTAALTAALRHPLMAANMVASLDHATGGNRLEVGLGSGFPIPDSEAEFGAVGVPFAGRVGRLDEIVRLWKQIWRSQEDGADTDFSGRYWQQGGLDRLPPTATPGGPRCWLAGSDTPLVLRRTARLYDGWLPFLPQAQAYGQAWRRITELAEEYGRPAGAIVPGLYATLIVNPDREKARRELDDYVQGYYGRPLELMSNFQAYGYGSADECAEWLAGYVGAGARHVVIRIGSLDPGQQLEEIADSVLPAVRASS
jgi:alkanesulfonate monooxygenase SsuD/methylene tetrahydromethanopterin reductase-like flavin-dependent oxidoreductase (luciferase family)